MTSINNAFTIVSLRNGVIHNIQFEEKEMRILITLTAVFFLHASNVLAVPGHNAWAHKNNYFTASINGETIPIFIEMFMGIDDSKRESGIVEIAESEFQIKSPPKSRFPKDLLLTTGGLVEASLFSYLPLNWFAEKWSGSVWELSGFSSVAMSHTRIFKNGEEVGSSVDVIDSTGNHLDMNQTCFATLTANMSGDVSYKHVNSQITFRSAEHLRGRVVFEYRHTWENPKGDRLTATTEGQLVLRDNPLAEVHSFAKPLTISLEMGVRWKDRDNSDGIMSGVVFGRLVGDPASY